MGHNNHSESESRSRSRSRSRSSESSRRRNRSHSREYDRRSHDRDRRSCEYRSCSRDGDRKSRSHDRDRRSCSKHGDNRSFHERRYERHRSRSSSNDRDPDAIKMCWKVIKEDYGNFDAWTQLLSYVEQLDKTKTAREAYDEFLKRYPYCYGYWRKYAEFERRHKHIDRCIEVYERGLAAIPLSVDLWLHYLSFTVEVIHQQTPTSIEKTRAIFDRAVEVCGLEFRSDKLWEEYIAWELKNGETVRAAVLFDRILSTPTLQYNLHFERLVVRKFFSGFSVYQTLVRSHEPDVLLSEEEYNEIFKKVEDELKGVVVGELYLIEDADEEVSDISKLNGEKEQVTLKTKRKRKHCEEALRGMRLEMIERRRMMFLKNEQEVSRRWAFEDNIKRPYFHVKPLEHAQIKNWNAYLDFEIERGDKERILVLFERCMIACALYSEMWLKYARYLERIFDEEGARNAYRRSSQIHLPRQPIVHLAYSAFEEKNGNDNTIVIFDAKNVACNAVEIWLLDL
ncbi:unnamed protein product [Dracunculus medinensis]|uniref:Suf domain-containing protein n=1 Tax=Dracunculus medinensis TaxID=318479 RepID=A0A158Q2L8_DRAME|nr:unnamed protein product [Dracunculus medinensis]